MNLLSKIRNKTNQFTMFCMLAVASLVASGQALAQVDTVGETAAAAITGAESEVGLVIGAMVGVLVILVAWTLIRKAFGK